MGQRWLAAAIVTNGTRGFADMLRRFAPLGSVIRKESGSTPHYRAR